jgi:ribosome-associated protein
VDQSSPLSKTQRKKEVQELQRLGEALVKLSEHKLAGLDLPERLRIALLDAKRFKGFEAIRRQLQYVGRVMRGIDAGAIRAQLEALEAPERHNVAQFHLLERWRERILRNGVEVDEVKQVFPAVDLNRLTALAAAARKETDGPRAVKHQRELFRLLHRGLADAETSAELPVNHL